MAQRHKSAVTRDSADEQTMRDQEVVRANRELAAYFKGRRTEREARAALKTIKAFVRDRERQDVKSRPPLPGADVAKTVKDLTNRKIANATGGRDRPKPRRKSQETSSRGAKASIEPQLNPESPQLSESDERLPK